MDRASLILYFRQSCFVSSPEITQDIEYLKYTDEDIALIFQVVLSRVQGTTSLDTLIEENVYPVTLLAKRELYHRLAVKEAPLYDIESTTGKLFRSDRFNHYLKLIGELNREYETYLKDKEENKDVTNTDNYNSKLTHGEAFLSSRYYSNRSYKFANNPLITLKLDTAYANSLEISWSLERINVFVRYKLYMNIGEKSIIDPYENNRVVNEATLLGMSTDIHKTKFRITDLTPETTYTVAIVVEEANGLIGYSEMQMKTIGVI